MPIAERKDISPGTYIGTWEVTESLEELEQAYRMPEEEVPVYAAFAHPFRKTQWLATRLLLNEILPGTKIVYDANGKPWADRADVHLSISHSGSFISIMISDSLCGVDIELIREKIDRIAPRFLNAEELESSREEPAIERMHVYWCVKEAIYKIYGYKEVSFRTDIFVAKVNDVKQGNVSASLRRNDLWEKKLVSYSRFRDCMMAWVKS